MRCRIVASSLGLLATLLFNASAHADVTLHGLFSDHMVLQRERPLPVWGKASVGEKVTVTFNGQTKTTVAGADGRWMIELPAQAVSDTPQTLLVRGNNEIRISDVLVGDVWLGSGQSNMDFTVSGTDGKERILQTPASQFEGIRKWSRRPSALYNGMIAPLQPYSMRGMIWYQGEWDSKRDWVKVYGETFQALAKSWRSNWAKAGNNPKLGEFPVYIVQLPSRIAGDGEFWPFMREVQQKLASDVPSADFVSTYDLNDGTDLHPKEKTEIGRRLARLALAREYQQPVAYHGPLFKSARIEGNQAVLTFDIGAASLKSSDGEELHNFELAGQDGRYVPAVAQIRGDNVVVSAAEVPNPVTVRFAWMPTPQRPNFFNSEGLPAAPFRTDSAAIPDK